MKTVALIPIKLGSKRVPGKNIKPFFDGTPLMSFIQQACFDSKNIDEVYIYCSDEAVIPYVLPGVKFIKRPAFLDQDDKNANDIIREFMNAVDADIYVNAHTTSPFAKVSTIEECVDKVASGEYDSAFCAESLRTFMWQEGKPINFDPDHFPRTQDLPQIFGETSIAYVFTKESFLKHNRRLGSKPYIKEVSKIEAIDIDYPEDFEIANAIYKEVIKKNGRTDY
ncbi:acylneuraminate cytidylyltransferase family protein [Ruminococcus sp.]|uniref:acylneuraminate cytidylyltransferase family protein n=1 Tax=Ruminococcus sp. TaxID=41978 RepID=UPI0025F3D55F|nr:acylneuraminate cytidylyltransferase family protein [Ruminococcus sp.]